MVNWHTLLLPWPERFGALHPHLFQLVVHGSSICSKGIGWQLFSRADLIIHHIVVLAWTRHLFAREGLHVFSPRLLQLHNVLSGFLL
jgi:hypothetical protein